MKKYGESELVISDHGKFKVVTLRNPYTAQEMAQMRTTVECEQKHFIDVLVRDWYLPATLRFLELKINCLVNMIFQEKPSLP